MIIGYHKLACDKAGQNAQQRAHPHLKRRMPDKFFQLIFHRHLRSHFPEQCYHFIENLRLNARLSPDSHRVVHDDNCYDNRYGKFKTAAAILDSNRRRQSAYGSGMGTRHTAAAYHSFPYKLFMNQKMNHCFQYLRYKPAHDRRDKDRVPYQTV